MPRLVKYEDAEGCIPCIRDIRLLKMEEKRFTGIRTKRYECTEIDNRK